MYSSTLEYLVNPSPDMLARRLDKIRGAGGGGAVPRFR